MLGLKCASGGSNHTITCHFVRTVRHQKRAGESDELEDTLCGLATTGGAAERAGKLGA